VKGAFDGFRLRDWSDYKAVNQAIGTGNGTEQSWQLVKRYSISTATVTRPITKPIAAGFQLFVDGVPTAEGWTLDTTTGILYTELTGAITATFEFDIPVRFEQDKIDFTFDAKGLFTLAPLTCTEIRIEPLIYPELDALPASLSEVIDLGYDFGTLGGPSFSTGIKANAAEFEKRKQYWANSLGSWDIGDRLLLGSELDYLIRLFRVCRGMAIPFRFKDWQTNTIRDVRFAEDRMSFRFDAGGNHSTSEVIFNLGGVAIGELPPPSKIDAETYVIPIIDMTSLTAPEISNIQSAITQLRNLLANTVYGGSTNANKYVKAPVEKNDERYVLWASEDYRDSGSEPKKFLFLMFVDESNPSYHEIPRNTAIEPTATWTSDFNAFASVYPALDKFYSLVFSPTGSPSNSSEDAFNPHLIDAIAGNNGYPALSGYGWTGKPYWDEDASGQDIYDAIIEFIS
jgi:hypothetical protein